MLNFSTWTRRSRRTRERGVAAVEFALVAPVLISLVFGIVEFGWAWNFETQLNNSTQIAARNYAVKRDWNAAKANVSAVAPGASVVKSGDCTDATVGTPVTVTSTITRPTITGLFGDTRTFVSKGVSQCN